VAAKEPGQRRQTHDPCGKVIAKGSCNGKRPTKRDAFIPAPPGSCFVLILNASGLEGLDLGEATHLIKTEPIVRHDKEKQAEARGRRLGDRGRLQIVQMLMSDTIEEATFDAIVDARSRAADEAGGGGGSGSGAASSSAAASREADGENRKGKRPRAADDADEGRQAAMLNALKLLRNGDDDE
jgi:hypothetical protein